MKPKPVLHRKSVLSNLRRVAKAMERNDAKVLPLLAQREELMALRRVFEGQLPKDDAYFIVYNPAFGFLDWPPKKGDGPIPPPASVVSEAHASAGIAEHTGIVSTNDAQGQRTKHRIVASAEQASGTVKIVAKAMGDAIVERQDALMEGRLVPPRKPGWPKGLSKKRTSCPQSPIPHRHRVDDPSKPTELTCVGIQYPEKAAAP